MDELVDRIVAAVGIERPVAQRAVAIILDFLATEGPAERVEELIAGLPGASEAAAAAHADSGPSFGMGGIMGVGGRLMAAGLGMGQIQGVTRELIGYAREKAGDEAIDEIVGAIPGLSQFV
jgi:hypothetical protein